MIRWLWSLIGFTAALLFLLFVGAGAVVLLKRAVGF
jgi:hypothetical protein